MMWLRRSGASRTAVFVTAAVLLRSLDAGATVGVVLIALAQPSVPDPIGLAAAVGAAITVPHVVGSTTVRLVGRVISDPRVVVAVASVWCAVPLAVVALGIGQLPSWSLVVLAATGGLAGPILTGGLSSQVAPVLGRTRGSVGWDALTYSISGTVAPALVAVAAALVDPVAGLLVLAGAGLLGGATALALPSSRPSVTTAEVPTPPAPSVVRVVLADPDLRSVVLLTWVGAFVVSAALILGMAEVSTEDRSAPGQLATALGVGGLVGAAVLIRRPPPHRPQVGLVATTAALALCCASAAVAGSSWPLIGVFALLGLLNAPHTVFSLAAREELPPPALRQQVFVGIAGTKVGVASLGTAAGGALVALGPTPSLLALAALGGLAALGTGIGLRRRRQLTPDAAQEVTAAVETSTPSGPSRSRSGS